MITEGKKLFWRTANIVLDDAKILELKDSGRYSSIVALSYSALNLSGFKSYSKPTLLIDLTKPEDDIIAGFNDTTRNEIRRTSKESRLSFRMSEKPDEESFKVYSEFEYSQGRVPVKFKTIADTVFFAGYLDGALVSGVYVTKSKPYLRIRSIFSKRLAVEDKEAYRLIGNATRRVIWDACLWGKGNGYRSLDMASVNVNNPKTASIARFKMSFGKDLVPEYTYIYKSPSFALAEKVVGIKLIAKKILFSFKKLFS